MHECKPYGLTRVCAHTHVCALIYEGNYYVVTRIGAHMCAHVCVVLHCVCARAPEVRARTHMYP